MQYLQTILLFAFVILVNCSSEIISPAPSALELLLGRSNITSESNINDGPDKTSGQPGETRRSEANPFKRKNFMGLKTFLLRYFIMPIKRTLAFLFEEVDHDTHFVMKKGLKDNEKAEKTYKCLPTNHSSTTVNFIPEGDLVSQMNDTTALCGFVLFYTPYCRFSIEMLPAYKALPRIFPSLNLYAVKINSYSSSCIQFGAVGTPTVMFYHNSRPVRKMPPPLRNISVMAEYVVNITDLEPIGKVEVLDSDHEGVELMYSFDWVLLFSVVFLSGSACYNILNTEVGRGFIGKFIKVKTD